MIATSWNRGTIVLISCFLFPGHRCLQLQPLAKYLLAQQPKLTSPKGLIFFLAALQGPTFYLQGIRQFTATGQSAIAREYFIGKINRVAGCCRLVCGNIDNLKVVDSPALMLMRLLETRLLRMVEVTIRYTPITGILR